MVVIWRVIMLLALNTNVDKVNNNNKVQHHINITQDVRVQVRAQAGITPHTICAKAKVNLFKSVHTNKSYELGWRKR